jgi:hypothetical protein
MKQTQKFQRDLRGLRMRRNRDHLGTGFDLWSGHENWFWFVVSPRSDYAAIGSAATEADAIREACAAMSRTRCPAQSSLQSPHLVADLLFESVAAREACHEGWASSLERLAEYVPTV